MGLTHRLAGGVAAAVLVTAGTWMTATPAQAAGSVSVANPQGAAVADPTYATKVSVAGRGFQSISGGHGGIYVAFGTVKGTWKPTQGGVTGRDYFYVPDSESGSNQGFQKFVSFPGSDTSAEANGGVIAANGTWSTTLTIPGSTFQAADRNGRATTIDCLKVQCGVITIGAHGLKNAHNETFTPVRFVEGTATSGQNPTTPDAPATTATQAPGTTPTTPATPGGSVTSGATSTVPRGKPRLSIDRASARAGAALSFTGAGMTPGRQVTVVFDDGAAAAGPFLVAADGTFAGVLLVPADVGAGTHDLRVFGLKNAPSLKFALGSGTTSAVSATDAEVTPVSAADTSEGKVAIALTGLATGLVVLALVRLVFGFRRRKASHG